MQHASGEVKGFTSSRLPIVLVFMAHFPTMYEAGVAEKKVKRWSRAKKEALIRGDEKALHELASCKNSSHFSKK